MDSKVTIITGANSGIGKETAKDLAKRGYKVIMLCRDKERGEIALQEVIDYSNNEATELHLCDLGSFEEIRQFTRGFKKRFNQLDVLINNAGVILPGYYKTKDGFELQFGVNYLGHFLLTNLLLDLLKVSDDGRIINVSSGAHKQGKIHFKDINLEKNFYFWKAYAQSKKANILFTYELARRLNDTNITVNCLHPGAVATSMGINRETGFGTLITRALKPFFLTPQEGAETSIYLATSNEVEGVTGKYFYKKRAIPSSKSTYDELLAKKLWRYTNDLIKSRSEKNAS
ncbi:NAD(P)-dependent dehydrogenase (short-subunit alcohol dehydrogenase family) [Natranaerovirga pectinivora]|uniref:NAD(P)-dependent dehydrogenase (Short-subunit alcohol dehydrogenase family) n=1 Tax=Natranaerovirga pectinivora TaxID=682400 RepID=A0A4R3MMR4_9FIRM|nr:SDR family oxidoreductase [Natranaerovirga pectinivora]TCT15314.1 NAD(P)-dependent dehydrogenase (short-subunit alcohol dehydrogenase family) [Natranaerovirga pectinivora]